MIPFANLKGYVNGPIKLVVLGCPIAESGYRLKAKAIKLRLCGVLLCGLAFLMLGGSASADLVETNLVFGQEVSNAIFSETSLAVAETNIINLSRERSNDPPFLGKLELAIALRYSREPGNERDHVIQHCEAALRCPLDLNDSCGAWQLLGDTHKNEVESTGLEQDKRVFRRQAVAAYLSGLKAAGTNEDWVPAFKGKVVGLYLNLRWYGEIYMEGDKVFPQAPVLTELVQAVEKTNYALLPPATVNRLPVGSMSFDAKEYEVEGVIDEYLLRSFPGKIKAEFKVQVKGSAWLIETTELLRTRGLLRSQRAGTVNSTEIYTLNVPINRVIEPGPTNATHLPFRPPPGGRHSLPVGTPITILGSSGKVVSNNMPLADDDKAIIPHLWIMFASHGCFKGLGTNRLTPVYEQYAPESAVPPRKLEAEWNLMSGSGALPLRVNYYTAGGVRDGFLQAVYTVTGITNFGGKAFPSGFVFEQYAPARGPSRDDMKGGADGPKQR